MQSLRERSAEIRSKFRTHQLPQSKRRVAVLLAGQFWVSGLGVYPHDGWGQRMFPSDRNCHQPALNGA